MFSEKMASIPTLTFLSTVRVAVEISNTWDFKMGLLEMPKEEHLEPLVDSWMFVVPFRMWSRGPATWELGLQNLLLPRALKEDIASHIEFIARRLSKWCHYNKWALNLNPMACIRNLKPSFFTPRGRIEKRRAAEEMARDEQLDVCDRFAVACFYALETDIVHLWTLLPNRQKDDFCEGLYPMCVEAQPDAVRLWPQYLTREFRKVASGNLDRSCYKDVLKASLYSVNDVAVRICYERLYPESRELASEMATTRLMTLLTDIRSDEIFDGCSESTPMYNRPDLCFLDSVPQMTDVQMERFIQEDALENGSGSIVLESLLVFWCDDLLLDFARILWTNVTEESYVRLVSQIHYRRVAEEFWHESPERYKHHLLNNEEAFGSMCVDINPDVLEGILAATTPDERSYLTSCFKEDPRIPLDQVRLRKYEMAIILVKYFDLTSEKWRMKLKAELDLGISSYSGWALDTASCDTRIHPSDNHFLGIFLNLEVVCKLIDLSLEFEDEGTKKLVKRQFATKIGIDICRMFLIELEFQKVDNFLNWCFASQREVGDYKKVLYEKHYLTIHLDVINGYSCSALDGVFGWFGLSPIEVHDQKLKAMLHIAETFLENPFWSKTCPSLRILRSPYAPRELIAREMLAWHLVDQEAAAEFRMMWSHSKKRKQYYEKFERFLLHVAYLDEAIRELETMARK